MSFLTRWSRLKREVAADKPVTAVEAKPAEAVELPPVDSLTFESDFSAFLRANVEESVKRAALKKLLHDPRFNVMDGLDTYIDDYTKNEGISEEMLKTLEHARSTLFPPGQETGKTEQTAQADELTPPEAPQPDTDGDPRQDA
ncbi:MAG: DUF3306 domain-containing protein [Burkholderiales bacterium]